LRIKDSKKEVKDFVQYIFNWVYSKYYCEGDTNFKYTINKYEFAYFLADKGIEKRLEKKFLKRLNLETKVTYNFNSLIGILKIEIY